MPKKNINNNYLFIIALLSVIIIVLLYIFIRPFNNITTVQIEQPTNSCQNNICVNPPSVDFNYNYTNLPNDVLQNPYVAPLRDDRYLVPTHDVRGMPTCPSRVTLGFNDPTCCSKAGIPINISTRAIDTDYRQVGILHNNNRSILPLMGRPLFTSRDRWQFYTMNEKENSIKLPIMHKGRSCTDEYGCDNLTTGDQVFVEGLKEVYTVKSYDNAVMKYLPFI
tara:strand:+ start:1059 stop:1724 length:666 start_codon:yes stop_codon:yes gene_type:complete